MADPDLKIIADIQMGWVLWRAQKSFFFRTFGPQFGLKIRRGGGFLGPPSLGSATGVIQHFHNWGQTQIARKRRKEDFFSINKVRSQILNIEAVIIES